MTPDERADACRHAADLLRHFPADPPRLVCGFDAFIDRVVDVVSQRRSPTDYSRLPTLTALAERIADAAGRSANLELVVRRVSLGGNGAILAAAAGDMGARTTFVGTVGDEKVDDLFARLGAHGNACVPIGRPGRTEALEFDDGKLMLGEPAPLGAVTWEAVREPLREALPGALLAMGNWTMTPAMTGIWRRLADELLPNAGCIGVFVDLADPTKRSDDDLGDALDALRAMNEHAPVTLGLNVAEAERVAALAGTGFDERKLDDSAAALREACGLASVALHTRKNAAIATQAKTVAMNGPFVAKPVATTGAGDHFNAGVCVGAALGASAPARLALGVACSGLFVRTGSSPDREALVPFLDDLPQPE